MEIFGLVLLSLSMMLGGVLITFYAERKFAAFIQDRMGPKHVGKEGILQPVADLFKLLQKEDIIPAKAVRGLFIAAPLLIFGAVFAGFSVVPFFARGAANETGLGLFFLLTIISLDVVGLFFAGWASNSKFSLLGALRSLGQIIGYEVPMGIVVLSVVVWTGSLNLSQIAFLQGGSALGTHFLGLPFLPTKGVGGISTWLVFQHPLMPVLFLIFFIASLAECNRAPFDLPEGESELVGGFHTEYSGFRFALFFLSEYAMMFLLSCVMAIVFLGAWHQPIPFLSVEHLGGLGQWLGSPILGVACLFVKALLLCFLMVISRWTFPRVRVDQLMAVCWKYLTPIALVCLLLVTATKL